MDDTILILGASSEIGLELISKIEGPCTILAHYNSSDENLLKLKSTIAPKLELIQSDLSSETQITELLNSIETKYGVPNKIIHLAAPKIENIRFKDINWSDFQREIDISLKSLILILGRFLPKMAKRKHGKVVCMLSSVTLNIPPKALTQYTTVKYAILGLMKSLASEYADKNIQINAISPSMINTKFLNNINEKMVELNAHSHPLKRNACVEDVVPTIRMLIGQDSDYINGTNIPITGGSVF